MQKEMIIPPLVSVKVEDNIDVMIVRDTARRVASLLGFAPAKQAQFAGAACSLAELVMKTHSLHELNFSGVQNGDQTGIRVSCTVLWLANVSEENVMRALQFKMGRMVDDIVFKTDVVPIITFTTWTTARVASLAGQGD